MFKLLENKKLLLAELLDSTTEKNYPMKYGHKAMFPSRDAFEAITHALKSDFLFNLIFNGI